MNLITDLQKSATNNQITVTELLRKALLVATKLNIKSFKKWIEKELHGYKEAPTPKYRHLKGELKTYHTYRGWVNINFKDEEAEESLSQNDLLQPIGEIETMVLDDTKGMVIAFQLPPKVLDSFSRSMGMKPYVIIQKSAYTGILDAVRTTVLEWTLKLENKGILGTETNFSENEIKKATGVTYNIKNFSGVIGTIQSKKIIIKFYDSIHSDLKKFGIPQNERNELENIIDSIENIPQGKSKKSLIKSGVDWLTRNATSVGALSSEIRDWFDAFTK